jgi:hypothetical protein
MTEKEDKAKLAAKLIADVLTLNDVQLSDGVTAMVGLSIAALWKAGASRDDIIEIVDSVLNNAREAPREVLTKQAEEMKLYE